MVACMWPRRPGGLDASAISSFSVSVWRAMRSSMTARNRSALLAKLE